MTIQDDEFAYYRSLGFSGTIDDMRKRWYSGEAGIPVTAQTDPVTGGIGISAAGKPAVLLDSFRAAPRALEQNPPRGLGVRPDALATLQAQDTWLGKSFDHIIGFAEKLNGANAWAVNLADTVEFVGKFVSAPREIKWAMPICTGVEPIAETISGAHDVVIRQIAQTIADAAVGSVISVRLGWEPNFSTSYPWGWTLVSAADYIAAFRRVSDIFRSVDARFQIDYCVATRVDTAYPFEDRYPGDAYVDVIGVDAYLLTEDKGAMTDREHVEFVFSGPCGINRVRDFAVARGKKMAIDEWGLNYDNPLYVERIADFVRANNVSHHAYWDQNNSFFTCKLSGDQHPNSAYAFVRNFGPMHIDTWLLSALPGQPLSGTIHASKPITRLEVIDGDATAVGRNGIIAGPQVSGSRRITVKAYDERGASATRSIVLTWQVGRAWTPAEFGAALVDWHAADFSLKLQRHINAVKSITSLVGAKSAAAATAAQRPTYEYRNGAPALSLDGGDGIVQSGVTNVPNAQSAITYAAMLYTSPSASNFTYFLCDSDSAAAVRALGINGGNLRIGATGGYAGGSIIGANRSIVVSFGAGATASCRGSIDGNAPALNTVAIPVATYTRRVMGANAGAAGVIGSYYLGSMYEWFSTNAVMTAGEEDKTHGYLCWKYGKEADLPGGHAYKSAPPMAT